MDDLNNLEDTSLLPGAPNENNPGAIWYESLNRIRARVNTQTYKTWFEPIVPLRLEDRRMVMQVPSQFFYEWIEEHHYSLINEVLTQVMNREIAAHYVVAPEDTSLSLTADEYPEPPTVQIENGSKSTLTSELLDLPPESFRPAHPRAPSHLPNPSLNSRYTFENYIKGESNHLARAAAVAVANNPGGTSFNPLVIYGGVGLGKTHLVQAIGNHVIRSGKMKRVVYVSSEKFTIDFVEAIQHDTVSDFSQFYRSVDLLIVDDIQFFAGKEKTQDIFFHTFNALHHLGQQIVLSSDKPPKDLKGLNDRLISRFQWGLIADIQPPDLETRIAILRKKSGDESYDLPHGVLEFVAANVTSNIRELEGCLISLLARSSLEKRKIDVDLAREVVQSIVGEVRSHITIEEIQRVVSDHVGIPQDVIRGKTRKQEVVNARQIAMYLAKELTHSSLKTIGVHFGGRDHSTVIHAYQTVEDSMQVDPKQKHLVEQLRSKLDIALR